MSVKQESEKVEEPLEGQTTNKDEPPQGDQEAAAEDKANNKWEEDFLWSRTALDFKMVERLWEDDDICEESWEADDPSDCSISNDWQQECGDLLDKKEYNWKELIFKRKMKDEGFEHNQPHHALIKQLKQLEHDNNTLAAKVHAYEEDSLKWEGQKNHLIEELNATRISREQISHCYLNLNKDYNDLLKKFNATNTVFKRDEQLKWKEEKNMITAKLDEATKSLEKYQGIANEFDEQRHKWEEEKNELNAAKTYGYQVYLKLTYASIEKVHVVNESPESYKAHLLESEEICNKLMDKNAMLAAKLIVETSSAEYFQKLVHEFEEKCRVMEAEKNDLNAKLFTAMASNELYKSLLRNFDCQ